MHVRLFSAAVVFVGALTSFAAAQSDPYTLRLMLGNDAYVWEQMPGYDNAPQPPRDVLNPGTLQNAGRNANLSAGVSLPTTQPLNKSAENALNFYGGGQQARNVLNQIPQRPSMAATNGAPAPRSTGAKPFGNASNGTTISPYLNLFREERAESIPNYHAFVRPQQQQMEQNRAQQLQTQRLQRQVQQAMYQAPATGGGAPGTGHATRFGNTGGYYQR